MNKSHWLTSIALVLATTGAISTATAASLPTYDITSVKFSETAGAFVSGANLYPTTTVSFELFGPSVNLSGGYSTTDQPNLVGISAGQNATVQIYPAPPYDTSGSGGKVGVSGMVGGMPYTGSLTANGSPIASISATVPAATNPTVTGPVGSVQGDLYSSTFTLAANITDAPAYVSFSGPDSHGFYNVSVAGFNPVPEPASFYLMLIAGIGGALLTVYRQLARYLPGVKAPTTTA